MTAGRSGVRVGVLMGGLSAERAVSLKTGAGVHAALRARGYDVVALDWRAGESLPALLAETGVRVVWNALHGTYGEDGAVQGLLACMGIACTGSGLLASALAMDKVMAKRIFLANQIPTPRGAVLERDGTLVGRTPLPAVPCVVKPAGEGSSVGVTIVTDASRVDEAIALARQHRGPTLVEEYIAGRELHVGVLDGTVLGGVEVRPAVEFYDYHAKYERNDTEYLVPPPMDRTVLDRAEAQALAAFRALGCSGHGRVDLRIDRAGQPYVLEVNTLPGMTEKSLLPKIAAYAGIDYGTLCERILASARPLAHNAPLPLIPPTTPPSL
jgi:D-alanine-D-alanine ligase